MSTSIHPVYALVACPDCGAAISSRYVVGSGDGKWDCEDGHSGRVAARKLPKPAPKRQAKQPTTIDLTPLGYSVEDLAEFKATVASVYSGGRSRCACGCSGKHTYASQWTEWASKNRGYTVGEDEVSDRSVSYVVNKIARIANGEQDGVVEVYEGPHTRFVSAEQNGRMYVAYLVDADTAIEYQACIAAEQHAAELQYNNGR